MFVQMLLVAKWAFMAESPAYSGAKRVPQLSFIVAAKALLARNREVL